MRLVVAIMFMSWVAGAATYLPIDVEQQLKESSGVIHGYYSHSSNKKNRSGQVITEHVFSVEKSVGLTSGQMVNRKDFKVMVPGGKWQGVYYKVSGTPSFKKGEEVVLLVSKKAGGYVLTNLALGKYKVVREDGKTFLASVVFPEHRRLGRIDMDMFEILVKQALGEGFEAVYKDTYVHKNNNQKKNGRKPASIGQVEDEDRGINPFWFILILALLGVYATLAFRDQSHDDQ